MPRAFLIVGVGGAGRGVCNLLKYELEQEFGSAATARTEILVIDGPEWDPNYSVAGSYQIDTEPGSDEFYRVAVNPWQQIRNLCYGIPDEFTRYLLPWLPRSEALRIPDAAMGPLQEQWHLVGCPSEFHAYVFVEASEIYGRLQRQYQAARALAGDAGAGDTRVLTVVIGSFAGRTGAGPSSI